MIDFAKTELATSSNTSMIASDRSVAALLNLWATSLAPTTRETYSASLLDFQRFTQAVDLAECLEQLLQAGRSTAKAVLMTYQADMKDGRNLAPSTVNGRLGALKSFLGFCEEMDVITWTIKLKAIPTRVLKDTAGPGQDAIRSMIDMSAGRGDPKGLRDVAILRVFHDLGLRRREVLGIDLADVDLNAGKVSVRRKGKHESEKLTLPKKTCKALLAWIEARGDHAGPLFTSMSNHGRGGRISGSGIWKVVRRLGSDAAGLHVRPHGLRHTAISTAADLEPDLHRVKAFSGHASTDMVERYRDNLLDAGGEVAELVADSL